ncbi:hypothetical protein, partial [Streptomyces sp. NPDC088748]|uniref:hypothetical protein n=1 Tax=Streptomyces sp. NPDC088748 TaxID=3365887 RepID=UPI00381C8C52
LPDAASPRNANLYTYTNNNPNDYTDPNGLEPEKATWNASQAIENLTKKFEVPGGGTVSIDPTGISWAGPASVDSQTGGSWQRGAQIQVAKGIVVTVPTINDDGEMEATEKTLPISMGDSLTYTSSDGEAYDLPGWSESMDDSANFKGLGMYYLLQKKRAEEIKQRKEDQEESRAASAGERECSDVGAQCVGGEWEPGEPQTVSDDQGNVITPVTEPKRESSSSGVHTEGNPLNDWQRAREGAGRL